MITDASYYTEVVNTLVDALEAGVIRASVVRFREDDGDGADGHRRHWIVSG
jgi:hypothetical protein